MTDSNLTEIIAIIDRSGSMGPLQLETIGGFNQFVEEQRKTPGKARLSLYQFDTEYEPNYEGVDINDVKPLDTKTYVPRGMTALYDAVGRTIVSVGKRLSSLKEEERPGQVIFLIITDGLENSSQEYNDSKVLQEMVKHQIEKYSWSFTYLGGGDLESQQKQGQGIGIAAANVYNYSANSAGTDALYSNVSRGVSRRRVKFAAGEVVEASASLLEQDEREALIVEDTPSTSK